MINGGVIWELYHQDEDKRVRMNPSPRSNWVAPKPHSQSDPVLESNYGLYYAEGGV